MKISTLGIYKFTVAFLDPRIEKIISNAYSKARNIFIENRLNGLDCDSPSEKPPCDGSYNWTQGTVVNSWVYGIEDNLGLFHYECTYTPSPSELEWFKQRDCNYLARILREGNLEKQEPAVWYIYKKDGSPANISSWWQEKLNIPKSQLTELMSRAETAVQEEDKQLFQETNHHTLFKSLSDTNSIAYSDYPEQTESSIEISNGAK